MLPDAPTWFQFGLASIGVRLRQAVDTDTVKAYWLDFDGETSPQEWGVFTRVAIRRFGWKFMPSSVELLDALRVFRGETPLDQEAADAYERVVKAGTYSAETGTTWTYRGVLETCGRAAADAFLAAGAHHAFATSWKETDRRERFIAAYVREARAVPTGRLLPAGPEVKVLPPVEEPTAVEAKTFLTKLRELVPDAPTPRPAMEVRMTDERLAELRRQAAAIAEEAAAPMESVASGMAAKGE